MSVENKIKVIISLIGLDGHTAGAKVVSKILRDAGMEVVYLGLFQMPEMIVETALQEDADVIGISSHASNYNLIIELMGVLKQKKIDDVMVICGGSIPEQHAVKLKDAGVDEVFPPGSDSESIIKHITSYVRGR